MRRADRAADALTVRIAEAESMDQRDRARNHRVRHTVGRAMISRSYGGLNVPLLEQTAEEEEISRTDPLVLPGDRAARNGDFRRPSFCSSCFARRPPPPRPVCPCDRGHAGAGTKEESIRASENGRSRRSRPSTVRPGHPGERYNHVGGHLGRAGDQVGKVIWSSWPRKDDRSARRRGQPGFVQFDLHDGRSGARGSVGRFVRAG